VSVVAARLYRSGKNIKAVSLDEPIDCKGKSEFVWIGLFEPSERELEQLQLISVRAASGAKRPSTKSICAPRARARLGSLAIVPARQAESCWQVTRRNGRRWPTAG